MKWSILLLVGLLAACDRNTDSSESTPLEPHEVDDASTQAFAQPINGLSATEFDLHRKGDAAFEAIFVPGTGIQGGLGPLFHANSCIACHAADGRGTAPETGEIPVGVLLRTSLPGNLGDEPLPVDGFGGQLQPKAITGETPEVRISVAWIDSVHTLPDGQQIALRSPRWSISGVSTTFPSNALVGARLAPPVFGLGVLAAITDEEILKREDPADSNKDGISGRANRLLTKDGRTIVGRFGWKANTPDLLTQTAAAYRNDMGITNAVFSTEPCKGYRSSCEDHPHEVDSVTLAAATFYVRTLAVPIRRASDLPEVAQGKALFAQFQCSSCHTPEMPYPKGALLPGSPAGTARAFTDLLLHDMGSDLADQRPDHHASGSEWRTSPLWGIGLTQTVHTKTHFLHDGRARSLEEAILWHGGEAEASREKWRKSNASERKALNKFLMSL